MKYEENVWHGWNGGECPVHPKTIVEILFYDGVTAESWSDSDMAGDFDWSLAASVLPVAFRVIKEHREPREVLMDTNGAYWDALSVSPDAPGPFVKFREVMEDDE